MLQMYTDKYSQIAAKKMEPANVLVKPDQLPTSNDADMLQKLRQEMQKLAMSMKGVEGDLARKHLHF